MGESIAVVPLRDAPLHEGTLKNVRRNLSDRVISRNCRAWVQLSN